MHACRILASLQHFLSTKAFSAFLVPPGAPRRGTSPCVCPFRVQRSVVRKATVNVVSSRERAEVGHSPAPIWITAPGAEQHPHPCWGAGNPPGGCVIRGRGAGFPGRGAPACCRGRPSRLGWLLCAAVLLRWAEPGPQPWCRRA